MELCTFFCGIHPIATAESSRAFRWSRPVGVIRPLLNLPYYGNWSIENKNPAIFATFLRLRILFCSPNAKIGCRTADYLRFCTAIRDRGSP